MNATAHVDRLDGLLRGLERVAVAVSGGVDSGVLLHAAHRVLGEGVLGAGAVGVIADSPSLPRRDLADARELCATIGAPLIEISTAELQDARYTKNDGLRCYHCRRILFEEMGAWAERAGYTALAYGEIADDVRDDRPGRRAAAEHRVRAPLAEAGWTKEHVRAYAREHALAVAERPASACLASRIERGTPVTKESLARIERAENAVRDLGFRQLRVRERGSLARLEVAAGELNRATECREELLELLRSTGFERLELATYRDPTAATS